MPVAAWAIDPEPFFLPQYHKHHDHFANCKCSDFLSHEDQPHQYPLSHLYLSSIVPKMFEIKPIKQKQYNKKVNSPSSDFCLLRIDSGTRVSTFDEIILMNLPLINYTMFIIFNIVKKIRMSRKKS